MTRETRDFRTPVPGATFLVEHAHVESAIGLDADGAPNALVTVRITGRWNHGAADQLDLVMDPGLAAEVGGIAAEAAAAAVDDLARYVAGDR